MRSVPHGRVALAAYLFVVAGSAEVCDPTAGDACTADGQEADELQSLLMLTKVTKAQEKARSNTSEAAGFLFGGCNEQTVAGLCYRTCTDMGEMESFPRRSISKCGGVYSSKFIQDCTKAGKAAKGSGAAPGTGGRQPGKCFGDALTSFPSDESPNMCTQSCKKGSKTAELEGSRRWCCSKGTEKPTLELDKTGKELTCSCPSQKKKLFFMKDKAVARLTTGKTEGCNTLCTGAKNWFMSNDVAFCCPNNKKPEVSKGGLLNIQFDCKCPKGW